ncbi:Major Facilitator Superfamily protein [Amycolatopsis xylanica]|uniref:Major Facilitator Superfamily protein n=1 Tax=Amycolatopsis xylanica TaxID=589385 RepID=A0A1H2W2M7_9PSEU|nr:MFS transporter [Amycolatopsis xylanica]SDW74801.1 Major Facilitator Superfamily protein [Amycolatopsis xylanica]
MHRFIASTRVVTSFGYFLTIPLLGSIALQAGAMAPAEVGLLIAVHTLCRRTFAVPVGLLCDRWAPERVLVTGLLLEAAGYLVLASSMSFPLWLVALTVDGLGGLAYNASSKVVLADAATASAFAGFYVATNVGAFLGPLVAAGLSAAGAPRAVFAISAVLYVASAVAAVVRFRRVRRPSAKVTSLWRQALAPLADRGFAGYCLLTVPLWFGMSLLVAALPLEAAGRGLGYLEVGLINALNALAVVLLGKRVGRRTDGHTLPQRAGTLVCSALFMAVGCALCIAQPYWTLYTAMALLTAGELALFAAAEVIAVQLAPAGSTGVYLGYMTTAWAIGGAAAGLFAGALLDGSAAGRLGFWLSASLVLFADAAGYVLLRRRIARLQLVS